jgi:hypothetical protein
MSDKPWLSEPDSLDWTDEKTGFHVRMRRGPMGAWCCYVGIVVGHPWFGLGYGTEVTAPKAFLERPVDIDQIGVVNVFIGALKTRDAPDRFEIASLARCHGGLTYAADHPGGSDGEKDGRWWFGFDCSHAGDLIPKFADEPYPLSPSADDVYRDVEYVKVAAAMLCADLFLVQKEALKT